MIRHLGLLLIILLSFPQQTALIESVVPPPATCAPRRPRASPPGKFSEYLPHSRFCIKDRRADTVGEEESPPTACLLARSRPQRRNPSTIAIHPPRAQKPKCAARLQSYTHAPSALPPGGAQTLPCAAWQHPATSGTTRGRGSSLSTPPGAWSAPGGSTSPSATGSDGGCSLLFFSFFFFSGVQART